MDIIFESYSLTKILSVRIESIKTDKIYFIAYVNYQFLCKEDTILENGLDLKFLSISKILSMIQNSIQMDRILNHGYDLFRP
jgi:hypothetical protein